MKAKTTDQMTPLRDHCLSHFAALRIPIEAAALDELLARAEKVSFSHLSFLDRLLGSEAAARRERAVARRLREAGFAESKTLEGFDWNFSPKTFDRVQMEEHRHFQEGPQFGHELRKHARCRDPRFVKEYPKPPDRGERIPAWPPDRLTEVRSRNGWSSSWPFCRIRTRPARSSTNGRPLPSNALQAPLGPRNAVVTGCSER